MADKKVVSQKEQEKEELDGMSFEQAMSRLEEIVRSLEDGTAQLDSSLSMFEEGVKLVGFCNRKLDDAERRIKILYKKEDGDIGERDFES